MALFQMLYSPKTTDDGTEYGHKIAYVQATDIAEAVEAAQSYGVSDIKQVETVKADKVLIRAFKG